MKFCKHEDIISTCNLNVRFLKFTLNIKIYKKFEEFFFKLVLRENFLKYNWYSIKKKKKGPGGNWYSIFYIFVNMNNIKDTNYFTKKKLQTADVMIDYW